MYELILLDADGTLFDYDLAERHALTEAIKEFGIHVDLERMINDYRRINSQLWVDLEQGKISKEKLRTERFLLLFQAVGIDIDPWEFSECYLKHLGHSCFLIDGAEEICKILSRRSKLYIVTNGIQEVQLTRLADSSIRDYIEGVVISEEVGVSKPDPSIFQCAFEKANHSDKRSAIMVGDSLSADIMGGINFGIDTCWVNLKNEKGRADIKPTFEVNHLRELSKVI